MMIKTYIVKKVSEAYPLILEDLGSNAFILNTKPIKTGWLRKKKVEVVAAADLTSKRSDSNDMSDNKNSMVKPHSETVGFPELQKADSGRENPTLNSQQEVLRELTELKDMLSSLVKEDSGAVQIPKPLEKWMLHLREQEVDEEVIQYLLKKVNKSCDDVNRLTVEEAGKLLLQTIVQLFEEGVAQNTESGSLLITLAGPTGVGKTTTIAKLAAALVFQNRQRVGLLTTDTFRIAAVEQLKTYASILNVPFEVVSKASDLAGAMEGLRGCQKVFMDSAGRNYLEKEYIEEINQYLRFDAPQENYLVLSMTSRWRDMRRIVDQMKSVPIDKLILTKWDETGCYGAALNMVYHYPFPLAYLSIGQEVPQDIMRADPEFMSKKILGVDEHEPGSSPSIKTVI